MEQESSRLLGNSLAIEVGSAKVQEPAPIKAHPGLLKIVPCWWRLARLWFTGAFREGSVDVAQCVVHLEALEPISDVC